MSGLAIRNVRYFDGTDEFKFGNLYVKNGHFTAPLPLENCDESIDGTGLTAIPGLVDLHLHGCKGFDVCDNSAAALAEIARFEKTQGIAYFMPATMTLELSTLKNILQTISAFCQNSFTADMAIPIGINLEGPFLSPQKCGAQDSSFLLLPDIKTFEELSDAAADKLRIVNIAPELPGAQELIRHIASNYPHVTISLAHTNADYDCASQAFAAGASHVTHLFNATTPFHHRHPGVIGAAVDHANCAVELICDGIHLHASIIRAAFRLFDKENILFVSDSMRATGFRDGIHTLGGQEVLVQNRRATLKKDGSIAGSVSTLMDCLRHAIKTANIPETSAIACATVNPARIAGISSHYGTVREGAPANILLVDSDYRIVRNLLA